MLTIRYFRTGKKHQPSFKIVVVQKKRSATSGKFIEQLGFYNPLLKKTDLKKERVLYWISKGATLSDTAFNVMVKNGVIKGKKKPKHKLAKKKEEAKPIPAPAAPKEGDKAN